MLYADMSQRNYLPRERNVTGYYFGRFIYDCPLQLYPPICDIYIYIQFLRKIFLLLTWSTCRTHSVSDPPTAVSTAISLSFKQISPLSTNLLQKLTGCQLVEKFPAFYRPRISLVTIKSTQHLSLSRSTQFQLKSQTPLFEEPFVLLSSHLCQRHTSSLFPSGLPTKTCTHFSLIFATCSIHLFPRVDKVRTWIPPYDIFSVVNIQLIRSNELISFPFRYISFLTDALHKWTIPFISYEMTSILKIKNFISFIAKCWKYFSQITR